VGLKTIISKTAGFLHISKQQKGQEAELSQTDKERAETDTQILTTAVARNNTEQSLEKLEKLEQRFSNMAGHLEGIDKHLQSFPDFVENQKQLTEQLLEYIRSSSVKEKRFIDVIERLPKETARQNKRFVYTVAIIVGVGLLVILALTFVINYITQ